MEKLKQIIESTLVNNLDTVPILSSLEMESVATCSDYIAQEIKDIAIEFARYYVRNGLSETNTCKTIEKLFNQFINDKYKES